MYKIYDSLLDDLFSFLRYKWFVPSIGLYSYNKKIVINLGQSGSSFSTYKDGYYYIELDKSFLYEKVADEYSNVDDSNQQICNDTMYYLLGLFYHEYGHVLFTPFNTDGVFDSVPYQHKDLVHFLFNVLEDPFIEMQTAITIRSSKKFFEFLRDKIFIDEGKKYVDNNDFNSFAYYLLLAIRIGINNIANTNQFYIDHCDDIIAIVKEYYSKSDGFERASVALKLYQYLIDNGMDLDVAVPPESSQLPFSCESLNDTPCPEQSRSAASIINSSFGVGDSDSNSSSNSNSDSDSDSDSDVNSISIKDFTSQASNACPSDDNVPSVGDFKRYQSLSFHSVNHEFVVVKDICSSDRSFLYDRECYYNDIVLKSKEIINRCTNAIEEYETENKVLMEKGYGSGYLDLDSYIRCNPLDKIYARPNGLDTKPDPCFYILLDCSGSMGGHKSELCTNSMIVLYECLSQLDIPFELSTFTTLDRNYRTDAVTYVLKPFDEDPSFYKGYTSFTNSCYKHSYILPDEYTLFNNNIDEVNLSFCSNKLMEQDHKDKILIVLSDGSTWGSSRDLREEISSIEDNGILVLGLGICSDIVKSLYSKNKVFNSFKDLELLPEFLSEFLVSLY